MKRIIIVLLVILTAGAARAQQLPFYSQYFFNPFIYNSAFSGYKGEVRGFLTHRNQWTGIQGAPVTTMMTLDGPIQGDKAGLGVNLFSDRTDILEKTGARFSYSYGFNINDDHLIKLGVGIGILNNKIAYDRVVVENVNDPNLFSSNQSRAALDADFGIGYFWKGLEVGLSFPQLLDNDIQYAKNDNDETVVYGIRRHYIVSAGYDYEINDEWNVYPLALSRITPGTPFQFDAGAMTSYKKLGWVGVMYKHEYAVGAIGGARINDRLLVGISYDFIINDISGYAGTSSELLVGYVFGKSSKQKEEEARQRAKVKSEIDSLKTALKETADQTDKNTKAIDSLGNEIQNVRDDVDAAIEQLQSAPPPPATTGSGTVVAPVPVGGASEFSDDYLDNKGEPLPKGFYIVVGSYSEQKWARQAKLRFVNAGFPETDVLYNITNKFYNVFLSFTTDEDEARNALKNARAEYPDAWLRKIQ